MSNLGRQHPQLILNFPAHPEYRFSNFIVSAGSKFACTTLRALGADPPAPYQTLFLSGDPGLGKTHLLIALGNELAKTRPPTQVLYMNCRDFIDATNAVDNATLPRNLDPMLNVDFLLMDDMDDIAGHPRAQELLYHVYNTLLERGKVLVFAGRHTAGQLPETESFLRSRFQWGMTVELNTIDDATTARIIQKLGQDLGVDIPDAVIQYLLTRIARDFQSIQDAVTKINHESLSRKKKVTLPLVKSALDLA